MNANGTIPLETKLEEIETNNLEYQDNIVFLMQEADLLNEMRRPGLALKIYDLIIEKNPDIAEIWYKKGFNLKKLGRNHDSVKSFRKAYELEPNNPEYRKKIESVKATVFKN